MGSSTRPQPPNQHRKCDEETPLLLVPDAERSVSNASEEMGSEDDGLLPDLAIMQRDRALAKRRAAGPGYRFKFRQPFHLNAIKRVYFPSLSRYMAHRSKNKDVPTPVYNDGPSKADNQIDLVPANEGTVYDPMPQQMVRLTDVTFPEHVQPSIGASVQDEMDPMPSTPYSTRSEEPSIEREALTFSRNARPLGERTIPCRTHGKTSSEDIPLPPKNPSESPDRYEEVNREPIKPDSFRHQRRRDITNVPSPLARRLHQRTNESHQQQRRQEPIQRNTVTSQNFTEYSTPRPGVGAATKHLPSAQKSHEDSLQRSKIPEDRDYFEAENLSQNAVSSVFNPRNRPGGDFEIDSSTPTEQNPWIRNIASNETASRPREDSPQIQFTGYDNSTPWGAGMHAAYLQVPGNAHSDQYDTPSSAVGNTVSDARDATSQEENRLRERMLTQYPHWGS